MNKRPAPLRMRDQLRTFLRDEIVSGELEGGAHLEEVALAEKLGSSRTPLREALLGLEQEGLVISRPHRGFIVAPADPQVVRDLYPILAALEALIVEDSAAALRSDVTRLRTLNDALLTTAPNKAAVADRSFHQLLRRRCTNRRLTALLTSLEANAHRLDGARQRGMADILGSHDQHNAIIDAIAAGDAAGAAIAMRRHWLLGEQTVLAWMEARDAH